MPKKVAEGIESISAGSRSSFFRKTDGTLLATGSNADGQLALGVINQSVAREVFSVFVPPQIPTQPTDEVIYEDSETTLSITAIGNPPLSYQWYRGQRGDTSNPVGANEDHLSTGILNVSQAFWVRVTDSEGNTDSRTINVTVNQRIPVFEGSVTYSGVGGELFATQLQATLGPLSFSSSNLPAWLSLDPTTGWLTGTPSAAGSWTFQVTAANYLRSAVASLTINIVPPKPVITSAGSAMGRVNDPFEYHTTATQLPYSYAATGLPSGLTINAANGLISGTPVVDGTFTATITAVNNGGMGQQTLTLTIQPPIPPPIITSPSFAAATANQSFSFQLAASNTPQSFAIQNGPVWLGVNTATGLLSGVPVVPGSVTVQIRATNTTGPGDRIRRENRRLVGDWNTSERVNFQSA